MNNQESEEQLKVKLESLKIEFYQLKEKSIILKDLLKSMPSIRTKKRTISYGLTNDLN